ncbi:hypothetical protein KP509_21G068600 [Ceratopteris richardii]|uniref:DUF7887 domain-containing protein n=1 Tax=Ceratopteris richardii TaxID=49495 RepID=A0A8T2SAY2_CERRI|nr:hypothetical protein KP509_21G068600 [Ceratopteris richardii]
MRSSIASSAAVVEANILVAVSAVSSPRLVRECAWSSKSLRSRWRYASTTSSGIFEKKMARRLGIVRLEAREGDAEREGAEEVNEVGQKSFSVPRLALQAFICILTLGFLDAGYSGDWSRIGVLSKDVEAALQLAAYGVVPLSLILLWLVSSSSVEKP